MQSDNNQIYKMTAERTEKSQQMYKDIGNFVFSQLYKMLRKPNSLIIKLKGVGSWHLRKKRMEIVVSEYPDRLDEKTRDQFSSDADYNKYVERKETYKIFQERLKDYEKYLSLKKVVREQRNKTQILLTPIDKSDLKSEI